ncbi:MAG: hypothetical protein WBG43_13050 [Marinifilaceae bacterium]
MANAKILKTNFSAGELSPKVEGRVDLAQYYKGLRTAKNAIIAPQGGAYKRFGTELMALPSLVDVDALHSSSCADFRLIGFTDSNGDKFLLVFSQYGYVLIYNEKGVLQGSINSSPYLGRDIHTFQYAAKQDTLVLTHPYHKVQTIQRTSSSFSGFIMFDTQFDSEPVHTFSNILSTETSDKSYKLFFNNLNNGDLCQIKLFYDDPEDELNLISSPNDFTTDWNKVLTSDNVTITPNQLNDPDGNQTIDKVEMDGTDYSAMSIEVDMSYNKWYTLSFYIQLGTAGGVDLYFYGGGGLLSQDLTNSISDTELTRVEYTFKASRNGGFFEIGKRLSSGTDWAGSFYAGWFQLEEGQSATDYKGSAPTPDVESFYYSVVDSGIVGGGEDASAMVSDLNGELNSLGYDVSAVYQELSKGGYNYQELLYLSIVANESIAEGSYLQECGTSSANGNMVLTYDYAETTGDAEDEPVWSETRGYPATCAFHQGRLYFGGSKSLPQTIWGSNSYDEFNFETVDSSNIVDTDYINRTITSNDSMAITSLHSGTRLIVGSNLGMLTLSASGGTITPTDAIITRENSLGCRLIPMVTMDNTVFYLQSGGSELNNIGYDYSSETYATYPNALLSDHLVDSPVEMCVTTGGGDFNSESLFVVNESGNASVFRRVAAQEVSNWSSFAVDGDIVSCSGIDADAWVVVRRENSNGKFYTLESMSESGIYLDCHTSFTGMSGITELTGLDSYAGTEVAILSDGYFNTDTVSDEGTLNIQYSSDSIIIGYPIDFELETMPVNIETQQGHIRFKRKRIIKTQIDLQDSFGFDVEYNKRVKTVGNYTMDFNFGAPEAQTKIEELNWLGWTKEDCTIKISSKSPYPVNIRSMEFEVHY